MITDAEYQAILDRCRQIPPAKGDYREGDFVQNLFLTVVDFMLQGAVVENAVRHYRSNCFNDVRTIEDLTRLFERFPDDQAGNTALAQYLWGYNLWSRAELLRRLVAFFESIGVTDQEHLRAWAANSKFDRDFKGRVKGLGYAVYNWLVMRQGVETVKPDVHLHRFVESIVQHPVSDEELVTALERAATDLNVKAYELDWRIWERQRGTGLELWMK